MRLTTWGHSCVTLDTAHGRVVIDPGSWSDVDAAMAGAGAVLVTHEHADHVVPERLVDALTADPRLVVHGPAPVVDSLVAAGAPAERVLAVVPGDRLVAAGVDVVVGGGTHAEIHPDVPRPANVGYLVGAVWHPGDSLDLPPGGTADVLLVPASAPWLRLADAIDLVRALRPRIAVPIHDAILSEPGRGLADRLLSGLGGAGEYLRPAPGVFVEI